jgi:diacylglycerol kinase
LGIVILVSIERIKDIAAGVVFIAAVVAIVIGMIIYIPKI